MDEKEQMAELGFPEVEELAAHLRDIWIGADWTLIEEHKDRNDEHGFLDVRLQVHGGGWALRTGDSSYDQDGRGWWGVTCMTKESSDFADLASDLIEEAAEMAAQDGALESSAA